MPKTVTKSNVFCLSVSLSLAKSVSNAFLLFAMKKVMWGTPLLKEVPAKVLLFNGRAALDSSIFTVPYFALTCPDKNAYRSRISGIGH